MKNYTTKKDRILSLSKKTRKSYDEIIELNTIIFEESRKIWDLKALCYDVLPYHYNSLEIRKGNCYMNSIRKMQELGYQYVEGWVINPQGAYLAHSWNKCLRTGKFYDSTISKNEEYRYYGCEIPTSKALAVIQKNNCFKAPLIPYLNSI
jgi:hypothetical protein